MTRTTLVHEDVTHDTPVARLEGTVVTADAWGDVAAVDLLAVRDDDPTGLAQPVTVVLRCANRVEAATVATRVDATAGTVTIATSDDRHRVAFMFDDAPPFSVAVHTIAAR